eukprot:TRINITY_DN3362_c0_g1_i3.p1 TRINITY_DN3362_c0_g1~~TRINITY_DN3362_c0_g1_i3.p1  ORF type:complete len:141 (-),score=30.97 TRINITY_DN3362_c0_g1_i3:314-736(-)
MIKRSAKLEGRLRDKRKFLKRISMEKAKEIKGFLNRNPENREFNQYWFSPATIAFLVEEVTRMKPQRTAFLSTPSVYYSLQDEEIKKNSYLFEVGFALFYLHNLDSLTRSLRKRIQTLSNTTSTVQKTFLQSWKELLISL